VRIKLISSARYIFLLLALSVLCAVGAKGQEIRFIQITDPHLFDGGREETENKAALTACIKKLNEQIDERADYKFAVMTGDIGVENLVSEVKGDDRIDLSAEIRQRRLEQGAAQLAAILSASKIRVWLFIPGNNDLFKEQPDTRYYRDFIHKLRSKLPGFEVIDLCPEEPEADMNELGVYRLGALAFIGFNNASFENENEPRRILTNKDRQLEYVNQVARRVGADDIRSAYIFYHIPELDDPHVVRNFDDKIPAKRRGENIPLAERKTVDSNPYTESSWFVHKEVHDAWKTLVVNNVKVSGLFAGHYHDWRRDTYSSPRWMKTRDYLSGSLSKLYLCPPLAMKLQDNTPSQARGFQEVTIDGMGAVRTRVFWFNAAEQTFDTDPSLRSNQLQLALFYEGAQKWSEAETNYTEAAKNAPSTAVRDAALAGLQRVKEAQHPRLNAFLRWTDWLPTLGTLLLRVLPVLVIALVLFIIGLAVWESFGAMVIDPFDGDEALSKRLAIGFPAIRAKEIRALGPPSSLPQIVSVVHPFVPPRIEDLLPLESFEISGMKVPNFSIILKWLIRPRFRVTGGILQTPPHRYVYAEVWRRKWTWFGSRLVTVVTREIPRGAARTVEIENFIIDVYLKTNATLRT
jgi:predicted DCC family thiol-disulfide oxidoreductase YuxK